MKTAVEWLETRAEEREKNNPNESAYWHLIELIKDIEQAKEMEKEQIMRTARQCYFEGVRRRAKTTEELIEYAEQYYNETFKQQEQ